MHSGGCAGPLETVIVDRLGDSEDVRDASRYFIVYETGDNTTTAVGEPEPLDLFYSRAVNWGDDYVVWDDDAELDGESDLCYPSNAHDDTDPDTGVPTELIGSGFCNEFDQVDQGRKGLEASEASLQRTRAASSSTPRGHSWRSTRTPART